MIAKRVHMFYSGRVQGVGFRYTTENLAKNFKITGWVRNLPDGRVEIVAEGDQEKLENFIEAIDQEMNYFIRQKEIDWEIPITEFKNFFIKF